MLYFSHYQQRIKWSIAPYEYHERLLLLVYAYGTRITACSVIAPWGKCIFPNVDIFV